jgi:hypothetical protein
MSTWRTHARAHPFLCDTRRRLHRAKRGRLPPSLLRPFPSPDAPGADVTESPWPQGPTGGARARSTTTVRSTPTSPGPARPTPPRPSRRTTYTTARFEHACRLERTGSHRFERTALESAVATDAPNKRTNKHARHALARTRTRTHTRARAVRIRQRRVNHPRPVGQAIPGFYGAAGAMATACPANSYCEAGTERPVSCPAGTQSADLANDLTDCVSAPGYYGPNGKSQPALASALAPHTPRLVLILPGCGRREARSTVPGREILPRGRHHPAGNSRHPPHTHTFQSHR